MSRHNKERGSAVAGNAVEKKNDVAPGGNKAVLTLADGSTISLDDAQNGSISQQSNLKVVKMDGTQT